eukprot:7106669-Pyramimonas_sp.AAC.1
MMPRLSSKFERPQRARGSAEGPSRNQSNAASARGRQRARSRWILGPKRGRKDINAQGASTHGKRKKNTWTARLS